MSVTLETPQWRGSWSVSSDVTICAAAGDDWQCDRTTEPGRNGPFCGTHRTYANAGRVLAKLPPYRAKRRGESCSACADGTPATDSGLCRFHAVRWRRSGTVTIEPHKVRKTSLEFVAPRTCECGRPVHTRGLCDRCRYWQLVRPGRPACAVEGCDEFATGKTGHCKAHFQAIRMGRAERCAVEWCESVSYLQTRQDTGETYCRRHLGQLLKHGRVVHERFVPCKRCGDMFDTKTTRVSAVNCPPCRFQARGRDWGISAKGLALRDGPVCAIGGETIDMSVKWPALGSPTVDHIVPRSMGGSDDPSNLQLACYLHNLQKGNRVAA